MVQTRDIRDTRPRFECVDCHERFWISYPQCASFEEVIGLREEQWAPAAPEEKTIEDCPKCHAQLRADMEECPKCRVIPKKFLGLKTASRFQGSERLAVLWKKIIDDYENDGLHQELIKVSSMENNLAYASAQYARLLQLIPHDERASKMVKEIAAIASVPLNQNSPSTVRVESMRLGKPTIMQALAIAGVAMIIMGTCFPLLRNLTGVGAVVLFIPIGYKLNLLKF